MMRLLLILAVGMMFLTACSTDNCKEGKMDTRASVEVYKMYEWPDELAFDLEIGSVKSFILGENGTTGYLWNAEADEQSCKVTLERLPADEKDKMLCGAPGKVMVSIEPLVKGESDVTLKYMRSWEPESPAHVLKIHVTAK